MYGIIHGSASKATPLNLMVVVGLGLVFLWKAHEALVKFARKDTLMVTEQQYPEKQTFPSVTICKDIVQPDSDSDYLNENYALPDLDTWMDSFFGSQKMYGV